MSAITTLDQVDEAIKAGQFANAISFLKKSDFRESLRADALKAANLARRCGLNLIAIRLLAKFVRAERGSGIVATAAEKAEYAVALSQVGATEEALDLLGTIDPAKLPSARLYKGLCLISQWEYSKAIPELQRFSDLESENPYLRLIARVNLAASLISARRFEEADEWIDRLLPALEKQGLYLLQMNTLELRAQSSIARGRFAVAQQTLDKVATMAGASGSFWKLILDKWRLVLELEQRPGDQRALNELKKMEFRSQNAAAWEVGRDCQHRRAIYEKSPELFDKLYYGSPYPEFRAKIAASRERALGDGWQPATVFDRFLNPTEALAPESHRRTIPIVDVFAGKTLGGLSKKTGADLRAGQLPHRLLIALSEDFYRPSRLASLHTKLYPGQYFEPTTSPALVQQIVIRLRKWLQAQQLPLGVVFDQGFYGFEPSRGLWLRTRIANDGTGQAAQIRLDNFHALLKSRYGEKPFNSGAAAEALGVSDRTAKRWLRDGVAAGRITSEGRGPALRYRAA